MPQVPAELTWTQVHSFRLERHHLTQRAPKKDLSRVVGEIAGAQAQLMSAAELQVGVRVDCRTSDVRDALWKDRTLVKTWLMRGTLHLIPAANLGLYTSAIRARSIKTRNSWLKFFQLSEAELMEVIAAIGEALDDRPQTREELIARVGAGRSEHVLAGLRSGWGGMLTTASSVSSAITESMSSRSNASAKRTTSSRSVSGTLNRSRRTGTRASNAPRARCRALVTDATKERPMHPRNLRLRLVKNISTSMVSPLWAIQGGKRARCLAGVA